MKHYDHVGTKGTNNCSYAVCCITALGCASLILLPLFGIAMTHMTDMFDIDKMLPLPVYYIYGLKNWPQYELTYIIQSIVIIVYCTAFTGIDNFLGLLVFHVCGQLDILTVRVGSVDKFMKICDLNTCVITHIRLLRYILKSYYFICYMNILHYHSANNVVRRSASIIHYQRKELR